MRPLEAKQPYADLDASKGASPAAPLGTPGKRTLTQGLAPRTVVLREAAGAAGAGRDPNGVAADAEAAVARASGGTGAPLPAGIQRQFEQSLGADLSAVRVHTGGASAEAAGAVGAKAYTVGNDIHFAAGRYQPDDPFGLHLLAHEVAHTAQQAGGAPRRQDKLEVSTPHDAAEHEADRAADAMVRGEPASIVGHAGTLARQLDTDAAASAGQAHIAGAAAGDIVLQVSNAEDVSQVTKVIELLERNQVMIEKGASMIAPTQRNMGEVVEDMLQGGDNKQRTQVPLEAIGQNRTVINALHGYLTEAGGQSMATNQFQDQYKALQANFGRLDGVASSFGLGGFKAIKTEDAAVAVDQAASSNLGGHSTDELARTFEDLLAKDPAVRGAREKVEASTQALEAMPTRVSDDMTTAISAIQTFRASVITATVTQRGVNSLNLRNALEAAKAKGQEASTLSDQAKELVMTGGKEAISTVAKGVVGAGTMSLSKWGALAAAGAGSGGAAVAGALADKVIIGPATDLFARAVANANASIGEIDGKVQLEADLDAEKAKQDHETIAAMKAAAATLAKAAATATAAIKAFVTSALALEQKKTEVTTHFTALSEAIKKASAKQGKGSQGKALAEMTGFLHECEQFVVQANMVIDVGTKGLGVGDAHRNSTIPGKASLALQGIKECRVWMAAPYEFRKPSGEVLEYYNAQQVNLHVVGPGLDATDAQLRGAGRADGSYQDPAANSRAANTVIPSVMPGVVEMRDKALALRNQIMAQVFGGGGGQ